MTLIANYIPFQNPTAGPNFYEFGDEVLYEIHDRTGATPHADVTYRFRFHTDDPQQEDLPLQHRPDHVDHRPGLEPAAVLLGNPRTPGGQGRTTLAPD